MITNNSENTNTQSCQTAVSGMLQWCYNYIRKQKESDEKKCIMAELERLCCK